jgi:hypothetical protein
MMPRVPAQQKDPKSPLLDNPPSPENILMAAATMQQLGVRPEGTPRPVKLAPEKRIGRRGK